MKSGEDRAHDFAVALVARGWPVASPDDQTSLIVTSMQLAGRMRGRPEPELTPGLAFEQAREMQAQAGDPVLVEVHWSDLSPEEQNALTRLVDVVRHFPEVTKYRASPALWQVIGKHPAEERVAPGMEHKLRKKVRRVDWVVEARAHGPSAKRVAVKLDYINPVSIVVTAP